jgi:hypothetical protein
MNNLYVQSPEVDSFPERTLKTFNPIAQAYGNFIAGFPWQICGCLTFRNHTTLYGAYGQLETFKDRLEKEAQS